MSLGEGVRRARMLAAAALGIVVFVIVLLASGGSLQPGSTSTTGTAKPSTVTTTPGLLPAAGPPGKPSPGDETFGVSVNGVFNPAVVSPQQIDAQLTAVRSAGAEVARTDAFWEATEPVAPSGTVHRYDWRFDDTIADALARHRLRWLPIIDYTAPWAESVAGQDHSPPRSDADYAAYASAFATRYGPSGSFWRAHPELSAEPVDTIEIWNEPDNGQFWSPAPDASAFANLYLSARDAIAASNPAVRVLVGGLTHPEAFLPKMLSARPDLAGHLDGVAIHPYGVRPASVLARLRGARRTLDSLRMGGVPLYVTEFGWTTQPPGVFAWAPAAARPRYIASTLAALGHTDCGVVGVDLYTWITAQRNPADKEDWYGIRPQAGGSAPDVAAFAAGISGALQPSPQLHVCGASGA